MNNKFREATAKHLAMRFVYSRDDEFNPLNYEGLNIIEKDAVLRDVDQLFEIREDGCRLAVVREGKGRLPKNPFSPLDKRKEYSHYYETQGEMLEAHYVQEEKDD